MKVVGDKIRYIRMFRFSCSDMTPEYALLIALATFWITVFIVDRILHLEKWGFELKPAYLMYRSGALKRFIERLSGWRRFLWMILGNMGLAFGVGLMVFCIYFMVNNLLRFLRPEAGGIAAAPVLPILPGITIRVYWLPYFFISVIFLFIIHEAAHGVIALLEKIPVKSAGFFLVLIMPGGFVEPDEKVFEKAPKISKLRVLSAGSSANLISGLLILLLMTSLYVPASGILVQETLAGGPSEKAGIRQWDAIYAVNETKISSIFDFSEYMANVKPGQTLILETSSGIHKVITTESSDGRAIIGVILFPGYYRSRLGLSHLVDVHLYLTLYWINLLSINIAIINMLPLYPFDGERFLYYILEGATRRWKRELRIVINAFSIGLLAANMVLSFVRYGLISI